MSNEVNLKNAKALAGAVKTANEEIGKQGEMIKALNLTVNQMQVALKALEGELLVLKVQNMGNGPTQ